MRSRTRTRAILAGVLLCSLLLRVSGDAPTQDPPAQDPPAQDPPAEDPPAQDPPAQDPPATDPPAADPDPPAADPPADEPPAIPPAPPPPIYPTVWNAYVTTGAQDERYGAYENRIYNADSGSNNVAAMNVPLRPAVRKSLEKYPAQMNECITACEQHKEEGCNAAIWYPDEAFNYTAPDVVTCYLLSFEPACYVPKDIVDSNVVNIGTVLLIAWTEDECEGKPPVTEEAVSNQDGPAIKEAEGPTVAGDEPPLSVAPGTPRAPPPPPPVTPPPPVSPVDASMPAHHLMSTAFAIATLGLACALAL